MHIILLRYFIFFFFHSSVDLRYLLSFPTRRSSDLVTFFAGTHTGRASRQTTRSSFRSRKASSRQERLKSNSSPLLLEFAIDRKSTRLNSSHRCISYAVFCLKKKKKTKTHSQTLLQT